MLQYQACRGHESYIPLNKIKYGTVPKEYVDKLKNLTKGKVELALNLVEYEDRFMPAIAHVFGNTFIAEDEQTAKKVAMENPIKKFNCVTLLGDLYRADGILSGGSQ